MSRITQSFAVLLEEGIKETSKTTVTFRIATGYRGVDGARGGEQLIELPK